MIVGGGIGGLATALALARRGIYSRILERRPQFSEDGAGIQIGPNGARILKDLGVADGLEARAATPEALSVRDGKSGRELAVLPLGSWIASRHGAPYYVAHRRDLQAALLGSVSADPMIEVTTGLAVESVTAGSERVTLEGDDGDTLHAGVVVAADGLWSSLRRSVSKVSVPKPTGWSAVRAVLPMERVPAELARNLVTIWLSPGSHVVHYPVSAGRELAIVAIFKDEQTAIGWGALCASAWVLERAKAVPQPLAALLAIPESWRKWSLHRVSVFPEFASGRIALIGDAAHPVFPYLAQGAVLALEDAVTLAACLAVERDDPVHALARYATLRRARAARVARASYLNGQIYHLRGPLAWARNLVLTSVPGEQLMAGYDWLYGHVSP